MEAKTPPAGTQEATGGTPTPQEGEATHSSERSDADLRGALEAARKEAASYRTRLKALEEAEEKRKVASLSEEEKRQKAFEDAQKATQEATGALRSTRLQLAVERAARKAGIVDEDAAFRLLDLEAVEFDDSGKPTNVEKLIDDLAKARPYLKGAAAQPGATGGSAAAPGMPRGGATYTRAQIADPAFFTANQADIMKAFKEGRIRD